MTNCIPQIYAIFMRYCMAAFIVVVLGFDTEIAAAESIEDKSSVIEPDSEKKNEPQSELNDKNELATENNSLIKTDQAEDEHDKKIVEVPDDSTSKRSPPSEESQTVNPKQKNKTHDLTLFGDRHTAEAVKQRAEKEADTYPRLIGETDLVIENNFLFKADDEETEHDDWLVNIPVYSILEFSSHFNLESNLFLVLDGEDNGLRSYQGDYPFEGLYIKMLKLQYKADNYSVFGGRYEPAYEIFGYAPIFFGNYSTDLNLYGQVSAGASVTMAEQGVGKHTLTGHSFYRDNSRLSGEVINDRGRNDISELVAGNTDELNNFLITLDGGPIDSVSGIRYTLGSGKQVGHTLGLLDEEIRFASLLGVIQLESEAELEFSVDFLSLKSVDGTNEDTESITLGFGYSDWPAYIGVAYSRRFVDPADVAETDRTDRIAELVMRYGLGDSTFLEGAYQWVDENGNEENSIGLAWIYSFDWLVQ